MIPFARRSALALSLALPFVLAPAAGADSPNTHSVAISGRIVSVDLAAGTVTADVVAPAAAREASSDDDEAGGVAQNGPPPAAGHDDSQRSSESGRNSASTDDGDDDGDETGAPPAAPQPQRVTILTDTHTLVRVDEGAATLGDLAAGDQFAAFYAAARGTPISALVATPAAAIVAHHPQSLYGFGGIVSAVDPANSSVGIDVLIATPSAAVLAGLAPQAPWELPVVSRGGASVARLSFRVDSHTIIVQGAHRVSDLSAVHVGDFAGAGYLAGAPATLAGLLATPLDVLVDRGSPAGHTPSASQQLVAASRMLGAAGRTLSHKNHHAGRRANGRRVRRHRHSRAAR